MALERKEDRPSSLNRSGLPTRTPIHGKRDRLAVKGQEPGFHYCWVNDEENGNIDRYLEGGYEFVAHDVIVGDKKVSIASQIGGKISRAVGNGIMAYLMRCTDEIYQEELDLMHKEVDEKEMQMKQNLNERNDGRYGSVEIDTSKALSPIKKPIILGR